MNYTYVIVHYNSKTPAACGAAEDGLLRARRRRVLCPGAALPGEDQPGAPPVSPTLRFFFPIIINYSLTIVTYYRKKRKQEGALLGGSSFLFLFFLL